MKGYGVPESAEGMMPWGDVVKRLESARNYWVATAGPTGRPHAVPVWGIWLDGALYFGMGSSTRTARNLAASSAVAVHLESGDEVVILEGEVDMVHNPDPSLSTALDDAFAAKYDWRPSSEMCDGVVGEGSYVLRPLVAFAWSQFPADVTRWTIWVE